MDETSSNLSLKIHLSLSDQRQHSSKCTIMWNGKYSESTLSIQKGWQLILGRTIRIPFPYPLGQYKCRTSKQYSGIDICATDNLFTSEPFIVLNDDPYQYSPPRSHQVVYNRREVTGCRYPDTHFRDTSFRNRCRCNSDSEYEEGCDYCGYDYDDEPPDPDAITVIYAEGCEPTKRKIPKYRYPKSDYRYSYIDPDKEYMNRTRTSDCVYLGEPFVKGTIFKDMVVDGEVYSYKNEENIVIGYLFTVGIWGACLDKFHSDEGNYEVAVQTYKDGITLVGKQNVDHWLKIELYDHFHAIDYFNQHVVCIQRAYRSYALRRAARRMAVLKDELLAAYYHPNRLPFLNNETYLNDMANPGVMFKLSYRSIFLYGK